MENIIKLRKNNILVEIIDTDKEDKIIDGIIVPPKLSASQLNDAFHNYDFNIILAKVIGIGENNTDTKDKVIPFSVKRDDILILERYTGIPYKTNK